MKIKPNPIEIPKEDPFKNDAINQKINVETFYKLIILTRDNLVYSIMGKWGSGKTIFLKMLSQLLLNNGYKVININAWENDFYDDPLPVLISEISENITTKKKLKEKIKNTGISLLKSSIPQFIKAITAGFIDINKPFEDLISTISGQIAKEFIDNYFKSKKSVNALKSIIYGDIALEEIKKDKNIFIIVDELDRCRPNFAIRFLELLKHIFNIKGVTFILAIDESQICESIKSVYGNKFDADGYLKRFFDVRYKLPNPDFNNFCKSLFKNIEIDDIFIDREKDPRNIYDKSLLINTIDFFSKIYKLSLRDVEQIIIRLGFIISTTTNDELIFPTVLSFYIVIRNHDYNFYKKIINNEISLELLIEYICKHLNAGELLFSSDNSIGLIFLSHITPIIDNDYKSIDSLIQKEGDGKLGHTYRKIKSDAQTYRSGRYFNNVTPYLYKKIDIIGEFDFKW